MKKCIRCGEEKELDDFYKHKTMNDGRLGKCKECCKEQAKERELRLRNDDEWVKKERARGREKYHRLNYKENKPSFDVRKKRNDNYRDKYPEKYMAKIKSQRLKQDGKQNHHWSYSEENALDVIFLNHTDHAFIHRNLVYNTILFCYETLDGELLDTREKHEAYIKELIGVNYENK